MWMNRWDTRIPSSWRLIARAPIPITCLIMYRGHGGQLGGGGGGGGVIPSALWDTTENITSPQPPNVSGKYVELHGCQERRVAKTLRMKSRTALVQGDDRRRTANTPRFSSPVSSVRSLAPWGLQMLPDGLDYTRCNLMCNHHGT